jgi:hypothetical protein
VPAQLPVNGAIGPAGLSVPEGGAASGKDVLSGTLLPLGLLPKRVETASSTAPLMPKSVPIVTRAAIEKEFIFMGLGLIFGLTLWWRSLIPNRVKPAKRTYPQRYFFAARVRSCFQL